MCCAKSTTRPNVTSRCKRWFQEIHVTTICTPSGNVVGNNSGRDRHIATIAAGRPKPIIGTNWCRKKHSRVSWLVDGYRSLPLGCAYTDNMNFPKQKKMHTKVSDPDVGNSILVKVRLWLLVIVQIKMKRCRLTFTFSTFISIFANFVLYWKWGRSFYYTYCRNHPRLKDCVNL